jgi:hypothetical protein
MLIKPVLHSDSSIKCWKVLFVQKCGSVKVTYKKLPDGQETILLEGVPQTDDFDTVYAFPEYLASPDGWVNDPPVWKESEPLPQVPEWLNAECRTDLLRRAREALSEEAMAKALAAELESRREEKLESCWLDLKRSVKSLTELGADPADVRRAVEDGIEGWAEDRCIKKE